MYEWRCCCDCACVRACACVCIKCTCLTVHADVCLVPEVAFDPVKLAKYVAQCLKARARCVICMAEVRTAEAASRVADHAIGRWY